jgi:uncharacterized repeat protein (TIGR03803 family)
MLGKTRSLASLIAAVILGATALVASPASHAQQALKINQEFKFSGLTGSVPLTGNLLYNNQQIFGSTYAGGQVLAGGVYLNADLGAVFQYAASGTSPRSPTLVYAFSGPDGARPNGGLVADAQGNLYGTTGIGGANNLGTVFKLARPTTTGGTWALTTLHSFAGPDGANPGAGVTIGPDGALYGTTMTGGPPLAATGVVFALSTTGTNFRIVTPLFPGVGSRSSLIFDPQGNIFGTTYLTAAARAAGSVFQITPSGAYSTVTQFQSFSGFSGTSTARPIGNIAQDAAGNIYGMLSTVQNIMAYAATATGAGVYKITAGTHQLAILSILTNQTAQSGVTRDAAGNLYGTTANGGATGIGSVFTINPAGTLTTLASLTSANLAPAGGVILDPTGELWGTSSAGGDLVCTTNSNVTPTGCGTLFSLSP